MSNELSFQTDLSVTVTERGKSSTCRIVGAGHEVLVIAGGPTVTLRRFAHHTPYELVEVLPRNARPPRLTVTDAHRRPLLRLHHRNGRWRIRPVSAVGLVAATFVKRRLRVIEHSREHVG